MATFSEKIDIKKQEEIKYFIAQIFQVTINPKQYTFWEIKNQDFTAAFYTSGKFVVQGKNIENILQKLSSENIIKNQSQKKEMQTSELPNFEAASYIGTDESGKGDFFGPLVVAGVMIDEKNRKLFEELGIKDSKTLKDEQMLKMAVEIQKNSVYSVVAISNSKYNELYSKFKNLNKLLAWGHARVIENICEKTDCKHALSDKFGDESLIKNALINKGKNIILEQRVRAESDIAVAAASVLARATFVQKMQYMENFYKLKFPKGCNNHVKESASDFIKKYGKERLKEVCKAHFKTYNEV